MTPAPAQNELLSYAIDYARAGFPVFPVWGIRKAAPLTIINEWRAGKLDKKEAVTHAVCECGKPGCTSPGKHPNTKNGAADATTDEARIRAMFHDWRGHIGLVMPPGMVAVDFDTYSKGVQARLDTLRVQRVATLEQQSGAGGTHLIFSGVPEGFQFGSHLDGVPGVDLIHAGNRYLVAEPSLHWTGQAYRWVNHAEPAPIPKQLLARVARGVRPARVASSAPRVKGSASEDRDLMCPLEVADPLEWAITLAAERIEPAIANDEPGSVEPGHVTLARAACHIIAGCEIDEETAVEILWEEYNPRCVPPWEEHEREDFERTVRAAGAGAEAGYLIPSEATRVLTAKANERAAKRALESVHTRVEPRTLGGAAQQRERADRAEPAGAEPFAILGKRIDLSAKAEPLAYLVEGLPFAPGGKVNALAGPPKGGKSPFALWLCISVGLGLDFMGRKVLNPGACLYLDAETGRLAHLRFQRMCAALEIDPGSVPIDFRDVDAVFSPEYLEALEGLLLADPKVLVVIDTYAAMLGAGIDYNSPEFAHWLRQLGIISRSIEVTFVVLVHEKKSNGKRTGTGLEMMSGSFSAAGACQAVITLLPEGETSADPIEVLCSRAPERSFSTFKVLWEDVPDERPTSERMRCPVEDGLAVRVVVEAVAEGAGSPRENPTDRAERERSQEILNYLAGVDACIATVRKIREHSTGRSEVIKNTLLRLVREGLVEQDTNVRQDAVYGLAPYSQRRQNALLTRGLTLPGKENARGA